MKKLLGILVLGLLLSGNAYADQNKIFTLSCEGLIKQKEFNKKFGFSEETKRFYEDIEITTVNKKIQYFKILNSSSLYGRETFLHRGFKNADTYTGYLLKVTAEEKIIKIIETDEKQLSHERKRSGYDTRLALLTSSYVGKWYTTWDSSRFGITETRYTFDSVCSGTDKLIAYLNNDAPSVPNINDNEILAASSGTGFFVSREGHLITNNHVVNECDPVKVIYEGKDYEAKVLAVDKMNDLAIIKANIVPKKVYSVSNEDAYMTEIVFIAGFPLGKTISAAVKASRGSVTALAGIGDNYAELQTDAALNSGNSGGPIFNEQGNVVGVAVSKWQEEGVEGFNFGVKSSILKIFANANDLKFLPPKNKLLKVKERQVLIKGATVYLECWMTGKQIKELIAQKNSKKAFYSEFK